MAAVVLQVVSRPLLGADMSVVISNTKEAAEPWRKHGAEVKCYTVSAG